MSKPWDFFFFRALLVFSAWGLAMTIGATTLQAADLEKPRLNVPADNWLDVAHPTRVEWLRVSGATMYRAQLSIDSTFPQAGTMERLQSGVISYPTYSTVFSQTLGFTRYFWRVRAENDSLIGEWSDVRAFTTTQTAGNPPGLFIPENNAIDAGMPYPECVLLRFRWSETWGFPGFRLQVSTDSTFSGTLIRDTSLDVSGLDYLILRRNTRYYWRVQETGAGRWATVAGSGQWSETRTFQTRSPPPAPTTAPELLQIGTGWHPVPEAESYLFQVALDSAFANIVYQDSTVLGDGFLSASYVPPYFVPSHLNYYLDWTKLPEATRYFRKVRAQNVNGVGPFSAVAVTTPTGIRNGGQGIAHRRISLESERINFRLSRPGPTHIQILTPSGRTTAEVFKGWLQAGDHSFPMPTMPPGLYLLEFRASGERQQIRLVR